MSRLNWTLLLLVVAVAGGLVWLNRQPRPLQRVSYTTLSGKLDTLDMVVQISVGPRLQVQYADGTSTWVSVGPGPISMWPRDQRSPADTGARMVIPSRDDRVRDSLRRVACAYLRKTP